MSEHADNETPEPDEAAALTGYQRKHLRGLAHGINPAVRVGKAGVTAEVLRAVSKALLDHELIKVQMWRPEDKKGMAAALAEGTGAHLAGLVGHAVILYRPHPEKPRIKLPKKGTPSR